MAFRFRHPTWDWGNQEVNNSFQERFYNHQMRHSQWRRLWSGPNSVHWRNEHYSGRYAYNECRNNFNRPLLSEPHGSFDVFEGPGYLDFENPFSSQRIARSGINCSDSGTGSSVGMGRQSRSVQNVTFNASNTLSERQKVLENTKDSNQESQSVIASRSTTNSGSKAQLEGRGDDAQRHDQNLSSSNSSKHPEKNLPNQLETEFSEHGMKVVNNCHGNITTSNVPKQKQSRWGPPLTQSDDASIITIDVEPSSNSHDSPANGSQTRSDDANNDHSRSFSSENGSREFASKADLSSKPSVRPKVDLRACKKKSSALSKEDLMKLISSPRSRQEHKQLNRILNAHAKQQKSSVHRVSTSESEDHEGLEQIFEGNVILDAGDVESSDIEVIELPPDIQREINKLCEGVVSDPIDVEGHQTGLNDSTVEGSSDEDVIIENVYSRRKADRVQRNAQQTASHDGRHDRNAESHSQSRLLEIPGTIDGSHSQSHHLEIPGTIDESHSQSRHLEIPGTIDRGSLQRTEVGLLSSEALPPPGIVAPTILSPSDSQRQSSTSQLFNELSCSSVNVNESRVAEDENLTNAFQISLREEEIRVLLKDVESEISLIECEIKCLKEKLEDKLNIQLKLVEEKVSLRHRRIQLLKGSADLESSTSTEMSISEALSAFPRPQNIVTIEPTASETEDHDVNFVSTRVDDGDFRAVLTGGFINIEPINDDGLSIAQGSEDEDPCVRLNCFNDGIDVQPITIAPIGDESIDVGTTVPTLVEHVDIADDALSLQPQISQENTRSLQNLSTATFGTNSGSESFCDVGGTVESRSTVRGNRRERGRNKDGTRVRGKSTSSVPEELHCGAVGRTVTWSSEPLSRDVGEREVVSVSADSSPLLQRSRNDSFSGPTTATASDSGPRNSVSVRTVFSNFVPDSAGHSTSESVALDPRQKPFVGRNARKKASFDRRSNFQEKPDLRKTPNSLPSNKNQNLEKSATLDDASRSCGNSSDLNATSALSSRSGSSERLRTTVESGSNTDLKSGSQQYPGSTYGLKRKRLDGVKEPQGKRKKFQEKAIEKKSQQSRRWLTSNENPSSPISVLYRHTRSARNIVLSDEVIVTASDDGQIIQHQIPQTKYGVAENLTFVGHSSGVIGLILAEYRVSQDITKAVILTVGRDQLIKMHCLQTGKVMMTHKFNEGICYDCLSEADGTIFVGLEDGSVARLTTSTFSVKQPFACLSSSRISALATCSDVKRHFLLIGFGDSTISVRDAISNKLIQTLRGHIRAPRYLLSLNKFIISSSGDCSILIHKLESSEPLVNTLHLPYPVVAMTTKDNLLMVATKNKMISFIDIQCNQRYTMFISSVDYPLTCLVASKSMIYFGSCNGFVYRADVDMKRHWRCRFKDCKDWFFWKGDLETHVKEEHSCGHVPVLIHGYYQSPCGWLGCWDYVSQRKSKAIFHYLRHLRELESEETVLSQSTD